MGTQGLEVLRIQINQLTVPKQLFSERQKLVSDLRALMKDCRNPFGSLYLHNGWGPASARASVHALLWITMDDVQPRNSGNFVLVVQPLVSFLPAACMHARTHRCARALTHTHTHAHTQTHTHKHKHTHVHTQAQAHALAYALPLPQPPVTHTHTTQTGAQEHVAKNMYAAMSVHCPQPVCLDAITAHCPSSPQISRMYFVA